MADLNAIVDSLSSLTIMEAADLAKLLEEKWGVSAAAPVAMAAGVAGAAEAVAEEQIEFDVILADIAGMILHYIDDGITEAGLVPPHDLDRKTAWELQELFLFLDVVAHRKSPVLLEPQLHAVTRALP